MTRKNIIFLETATLMAGLSLTACSNSDELSQPQKISLTQMSKSKNKRNTFNEAINKKLKEQQKKANKGKEDYNYALYLHKINITSNKKIDAFVDSANVYELSPKEVGALGICVNKLIDNVLKDQNVKFNKDKGIYITMYDEDGDAIVDSFNYKTGKYESKAAEKAANVPREYQNAVIKAQSYSDNMYMSKQGIYDQLTSNYGEDFSEKAANYAIKHVKANWKENALEKAKSYQKNQAMSKNNIKDQLTSSYGEKFTESEAEYAIEHLDD